MWNMLILQTHFFAVFIFGDHFSGLLILGVPSDTICCIWIGVCCFMQDYSAMIMIPTSLWSRTVSSIFEMPTWEKQTLADWWDDWNSSVRKVAYHGPLRKTTRGSAFGADITLRSSWYISVLCDEFKGCACSIPAWEDYGARQRCIRVVFLSDQWDVNGPTVCPTIITLIKVVNAVASHGL